MISMVKKLVYLFKRQIKLLISRVKKLVYLFKRQIKLLISRVKKLVYLFKRQIKLLISRVKKLVYLFKRQIKLLTPKIKKKLSLIYHKLYTIYLKIIPNYSLTYQWHAPNHIDNNVDVAVTVAFLGRHKVLHAIIEEILNSSNHPLNIYMVLACSNDEDFEFAHEMQEVYKKIGIIFCDNKPVGNKWHIAVQGAKKLNPKAILITGSDDLVSSDYIQNSFGILSKDKLNTIGMVGPRSWYIYDLLQDDLYKTSYNDNSHKVPLGAGRLYSKFYLDSIGWKLFIRDRNFHLDSKGYLGVIENGLHVHIPSFDDGCVLSIKGDWSTINSLDKILKADSIIHSKSSNQEKNIILHKFKNSFEILNNYK